jgi:hypothetical protein
MEWRRADKETAKVMRKALNKDKWWGPIIQPEDIGNFPCEDLRTIDQLWMYYSRPKFGCSSNPHFGYSVQKEIYIGLGGKKGFSQELTKKLGSLIGWRKQGPYGGWYEISCNDLNFNLDPHTPRGHLPTVFETTDLTTLLYLFHRLEACG